MVAKKVARPLKEGYFLPSVNLRDSDDSGWQRSQRTSILAARIGVPVCVTGLEPRRETRDDC